MFVVNQSTCRKILLMLAVAILIEPNYFAQGPLKAVDFVYSILKIICTLLILFRFFICLKVRTGLLLVFLYEGVMLISTALGGGSVLSFVKINAYIVVMAILLEWMLEQDAPSLISAVSSVFGIYTYISLLTWILFPEGMYTHPLGWKNCWFLGYKNIATPILLVGMVCALFDSYMKYKRISWYAWSVVVCAEIYMFGVSSVTGMVTSIVALAVSAVSYWMDVVEKILNCKNIVIGNFILFVLIVFVRIQNVLDIFGNIVIQMGKNLTFSSRTYLWDRVIPLIRDSLILGNGAQEYQEYVNLFHYWWAVHLHSYYLQVLFEGGLTALGLVFVLLFLGGMNFDQHSKVRASMIIKYGLMAYLLANQLEMYGQVSTMFMLVFMHYHIEEIEDQYEQLRQKYVNRDKRKVRLIWGKKLLYREDMKMNA